MCSPTRYSIGMGRRRRRNGALAGDRSDTEGAPRKSARKAWPLRFSAGSRRLRTQGTLTRSGMKTTCHKTPAPVIPETTLNRPWSPQLFEEITDLLAEALFQDFQAHRRATVQSPQGSNRKISLTRQDDWNK
jgi:hypothetical protein